MTMPQPNTVRFATCIHVIDGDTILVRIEHGFGVELSTRGRLARINSPELHATDPLPGKQAQEFLNSILKDHSLIIESHGHDRYGREILEVWDMITKQNISDLMLLRGFAVPYKR